MTALDEFQAQMDEQFPRGAHVWMQRDGATLFYETQRVMVVAEGRIALPPSDIALDMVFSYSKLGEHDGITVLTGDNVRIQLSHNFTPNDAIDRQRTVLYGQADLDLMRRREE